MREGLCMFGRSEDIFEEEKTKDEKLTREEKKQERLQQKELKRQEKEDLKQQKAAFEEEMRNREEERKRQEKLEKEDEKNARLAAKAAKKIEKVEKRANKPKKSALSIILAIVLVVLFLASGFGVTAAACLMNAVTFSILLMWPLVVSVDVFFFSSAGFFVGTGKKEMISAAVSFVSLGASIVLIAKIF